MAEGEGKRVEILDLSEVAFQFGRPVIFCLEPEEVRLAKIKAGKEAELWCFDPAIGRIRRGDGKFCDARIVDRGGYNQLAIHEEPNVPVPEDGSPRVVGHVIIERNPRGLVHVRKTNGLNGEVLEFAPSSVSKGKLAAAELTPVSFAESNPQRIIGMMAVYLVEVDFPDEEGMTPAEFRKQSRDARSLAALDKAGL